MELLSLAVRIFADDQASREIDGVASGIIGKMGNAAKVVAGAMTAATAAVGAAVVAIGKQAFDSYAQFEQLEGGVEKLFGNSGKTIEEYAEAAGKSVAEIRDEYQRNEEAQNKMMTNAQEAYKNMGLSANEYISQATSFSAALISSLGGDTSKAADMANVAMTSMADNVSIFGSNVEDVQNAYQGFAKQNFSMLDNLKLGYGGTKSEMERLIADANEYAASIGQASDLSIDSFADIVQAIDLVQQKQGIAGNAAKEASKTLEGSINSVKAAWQNLLTEIGKPDGDIGARTQELMESMNNVVTNAIPVIRRIAEGIAAALPEIIPSLFELARQVIMSIGEGLVQSVPSIMESIATAAQDIAQMMSEEFSQIDFGAILSEGLAQAQSFSEWLTGMLPSITEGLMGLLEGAVAWLTEHGGEVLDAVLTILEQVATGLVESAPEIISSLGTILGQVAAFLAESAPKVGEFIVNLIALVVEHAPELLAAVIEFFGNFITGLIEKAPEILENFGHMLGDLIGKVAEFVGGMIKAGADFIAGFLSGNEEQVGPVRDFFVNLPQNLLNALGAIGTFLLNAGKSFLNGLLSGVKGAAPNVVSWFQNLPTNLKNALGNLGSFLLQKGKDLLNGLWNGTKNVFQSVKDWFANLPENVKNAVGDLSKTLWNAGQDIINGFLDGLQNAFHSVEDWVLGIGDWIANNKGPKEYDLKLLVPNARWIMQGLAKGLRDNIPLLESALDDVTGTIAGTSIDVAAVAPRTAGSDGRGNVYVYMTYNAGEDGTELVNDMARQLRLYGYSLGPVGSFGGVA